MSRRFPAGVYLTGQDAAVLDAVLRRAVADIARRNGTVPAVLVRLAEDVHRAAVEFRTTVLVEAGSGTAQDAAGSDGGSSITSDRLTVRSAARIAGTSESYLRRLARRGVLQGTQGPRGGWVLDGGSVAAWLAERNEQQAA